MIIFITWFITPPNIFLWPDNFQSLKRTGEIISENIQRKFIAPLKQLCSRWWSICLFPSHKKPLSIVNCFDPKQCLKILKCCKNAIRLSRSPSFRLLNYCTWNLADISLLTIHGFRATFVSWYIIQLLKFHELLQGMYELRNLFVFLCELWWYVKSVLFDFVLSECT